MQAVLALDYLPLVSIIVPITDDVDESGRRLASAKAQTWPNLEIIPVQSRAFSGLAQVLNHGLELSTGDFISFLLPGVCYAPEKITRQVDFVSQFDLEDSAIFCDYTIVDSYGAEVSAVSLPSFDPSVMFSKVYCGLAVNFSSLLVSRKAWLNVGLFPEYTGRAALEAVLLALTKRTNLVGMASSLLSVCLGAQFCRREKRDLRRLYALYFPEVVQRTTSDIFKSSVFAHLGEAAVARLEAGSSIAALDACYAAGKLFVQKGGVRGALPAFFTPFLRRAWRWLPAGLKQQLRIAPLGETGTASSRLDFSAIYRNNGFVGTESLSGAGSTRFQTRVIRQRLPELVRELGVQSILDIPCGDFHWMRDVDLAGIWYVGADVVDEMVQRNRDLFGSAFRRFECVNLITGPLPVADMVFCRDCLVHLPYEDALAALETIRQSSCRWLLTTTFTRATPNIDLNSAGWRPLNLMLPPFNLPAPARLITEKCTEAGGLAGDKSLGLWRISDLPSFGRPSA